MNTKTFFAKHAPAFNASKEDEIQFLRDIEGSLNPNTYIASLITSELLDYFIHTVKEDHCPDIYHAMTFYRDRARDLEVENSTFARNLAIANDLLVSKAQEYNATLEVLRESNASKDETINGLSIKLEEAKEAAYQESYDRDHDKQDYENEIASLKEQIRTLKVRLYDIEHPQ